jgi:2'-5' RNA ligase
VSVAGAVGCSGGPLPAEAVEDMRLFLATMLPDAVGEAVEQIAADVRRQAGDIVRPVPPGSAHITHAFFGDVSDRQLDELRAAVTDVARRAVPVDVTFGPPEVLAGGRTPRLVLVPVLDGRQALFDLQVNLVLAVRRVASFERLPLPKAPHVTVARFRRGAGQREAERVARVLARVSPAGLGMRVDRLQLVESLLMPDGPRYTALDEVDLSA